MDFGGIVGPALATLGPWGLLIMVVAIVLTAFVKGALVSGSAVERTEAQRKTEQERLVDLWEARLKESIEREQAWRTAFQESDLRADALASQVDKLMIYAQTADQVLRALPPAAARNEH